MSNYNSSNIFASARLVWTRHATEYSPAKPPVLFLFLPYFDVIRDLYWTTAHGNMESVLTK